MAHDITIPKLGLTMEEASIVEWHRADGEPIAKGEALFTIETEKVAFEVVAEADGFVQRIAAIDAVLPVGALVGRLHETAEAALSAGQGATIAAATPSSVPAPAPAPVASTASVVADSRGDRRLASPLARRLAEERSIDLGTLATGSGPQGAILERDIEAAAARATRNVVDAAIAATAAPAATGNTRRALAGMRRTIGQRMMASLSGSAQMTAFGRIDMTQAVALRERLVEDADRLGARITYTDLVLKCIASTLAEMPQLNAWIEGDEIVEATEIHLGLAVALDDGLVVPVIRHVDQLSLVELSRARQAAIEKARAHRSSPEDLRGGGFTLSNFGSYGGDFETPILNPPQSAMLGIGRIADDVVAHQGAVAIRPMMWISMTFDHRLIDGAVAGRFRARLKALLEEPTRLLATLR